MTGTPFDSFLEVLNRMTPAQKAELIHNHQEFVRLKSLCVAKKWIEIGPNMSKITVLKKKKEVNELKKIFLKLVPRGIEWIDKLPKNTP